MAQKWRNIVVERIQFKFLPLNFRKPEMIVQQV